MQSASTASTFTAAQIAIASGKSAAAIRQNLADVGPAAQVIRSGNLADVWRLDQLPVAMQSTIADHARQRGYRDSEHLLTEPGATWQPPTPLAQCGPDAVARAAKLKSAFLPLLEAIATDSRTQSEIEASLANAYQVNLGHAITPRWARHLFNRTIERDRGRREWHRLELYLDEKTGRKPGASKPKPCQKYDLSPLADALAAVKNVDDPTLQERAFLFDSAFRCFCELKEAAPAEEKAIRRVMVGWLFKAARLSKDVGSLKRTFQSKFIQWEEGGRAPLAIEDKRRDNSGNWRKPDFKPDLEKIRNSAVLHGGNETLAYRKLRQAGELSDAFVNHYRFDPSDNKSYVPGPVRAAITNEVEMCGPIHRGPWQAKMRGPYTPRDWSGVAPGDWFSGDDVTWNHYWYFHDERGQLHIERGECLLLHDLRTGYILDFVLVAGKYNSRHIRKLILAVHDRHGLPHTGFYFERGVWKARVITDIAAREDNPWRETESGLAEYGLQLTNARTPRAKTIEGLIRILQERMRTEPGFVGFNERSLEMERMQDFLARCHAGKAHPADKLLSMEQWKSRLDAIITEFNADVQNGKMLRGQSAQEAWHAGLAKTPLRQLPESARYLLATHCRKAKVHQHGIVLTIGKNQMLFCNDQTGPLIGREVLAFFNLECPELLTVTDLKRQNPFTVKAISLPAMSATKEQFAAAHAQTSGHTKHTREIYGSIQHRRISTVANDTLHTETETELGEFHNAETNRFKHEQAARNRALRKLQAVSRGEVITDDIADPQEALDSAEKASRLLQEIRAEIRAKDPKAQ